jgi:hypothetical protein
MTLSRKTFLKRFLSLRGCFIRVKKKLDAHSITWRLSFRYSIATAQCTQHKHACNVKCRKRNFLRSTHHTN